MNEFFVYFLVVKVIQKFRKRGFLGVQTAVILVDFGLFELLDELFLGGDGRRVAALGKSI